VKIRTLLEILSLNSENYDTAIDYMVEVVGIYQDIDNETVYEYSQAELKQYFARVLREIHHSPQAVESFTLENHKFEKLPFEKLSLGAYIDLENFSQKPEDIGKIVSILYRRTQQVDNFSEKVFEPYDDWLNVREKAFLDLQAADVVGIKSEWIEWKNTLTTHYSGLFDTYQGDEDTESMDEISRIEAENAKRMDEKRKAFAWESTILRLCNQNAAEFTKILDMPVILVFNILSTLKIEQ
jgi:hypothetical protein